MDVFLTHLKNKNFKSLTSNLLLKLVFLAHETLEIHFATREKNFSFNLERYDLTNGKEFESNIWDTYTCTSKVLDPTAISPQNTSKLKNLHLVLKESNFRVFSTFEAFQL